MASLVWISPRSTRDLRIGPVYEQGRKTRMHRDAVYTDAVCQDVVGSLEVLNASQKELEDMIELNADKALSLLLVKPVFSPDIDTVLTRTQREISDFWMCTHYRTRGVWFAEVLDAAELLHPEPWHSHANANQRRSTFVNMSRPSAARALSGH